jgi:cytochrome c biogenesis protein CcdA
MWTLLLIGISLGLLDCLNPFTISAQAVLHTLVKKTHHVLYYIVGTFLTYFIGGIFVFFGIDKVISLFLKNIMTSHGIVIFSIEIALGIGLFLLGAFLLYKQIKKIKTDKSISGEQTEDCVKGENTRERKFAPKHIKPVYLFFLGASNTIFDLPTGVPYLLFIAQIVEAKLTIGKVLFLFTFYNLIYILPLVALFILHLLLKEKAEKITEKIKTKIAFLSGWAAIIIPIALGVFLGIHGYNNLIS